MVAAIVLVAAFLVYRKFFAKKGTPKRSPLEILESLKAGEAGKKTAAKGGAHLPPANREEQHK